MRFPVKIFYLTSEFLWPPHHGGRVRSLAQLRLLASLPEVERVTMLGTSEDEVTTEDADALAAELPGVRVLPAIAHPIHLREHPLSLAGVAARRFLLGTPYLAAKWESAELRRVLSAQLAGVAYDVVYLDHVGMAGYLGQVRRERPSARVVIDAHNVESDFFLQLAERRRGAVRWLALREWELTRRFEARVLKAADAVVAISEPDAVALSGLCEGRTPVIAVPQVVRFTPRQRRGTGLQLCYVGNLTWHPNVRGLSWFCGEVWPLVRAALPEATLVIAGSGLPSDEEGRPQAPQAWQVEGVTTVGFLPELEPLYAASVGAVAPILDGSGVRIKLLESLRAGMPVVTTGAGAAGLPLQSGREVLIEDSAAGFAAAVVRLLREPGLQEGLREAGYRYLRAHHALEVAQDAMRRALGLGATAS